MTRWKFYRQTWNTIQKCLQLVIAELLPNGIFTTCAFKGESKCTLGILHIKVTVNNNKTITGQNVSYPGNVILKFRNKE